MLRLEISPCHTHTLRAVSDLINVNSYCSKFKHTLGHLHALSVCMIAERKQETFCFSSHLRAAHGEVCRAEPAAAERFALSIAGYFTHVRFPQPNEQVSL